MSVRVRVSVRWVVCVRSELPPLATKENALVQRSSAQCLRQFPSLQAADEASRLLPGPFLFVLNENLNDGGKPQQYT